MRKTYSPEFKAKLVMEVFKGERLLNEIASENNVHPNMLTCFLQEPYFTINTYWVRLCVSITSHVFFLLLFLLFGSSGNVSKIEFKKDNQINLIAFPRIKSLTHYSF